MRATMRMIVMLVAMLGVLAGAGVLAGCDDHHGRRRHMSYSDQGSNWSNVDHPRGHGR
ncbi:MAG: hypothetical protein ACE15C_15820 [Phycisphaerae bacterium]